MAIISSDLIYHRLLTNTFGTDHVTSTRISRLTTTIKQTAHRGFFLQSSRLRLLTAVEHIRPSTVPSVLGSGDISVRGLRARFYIPKHENSEHHHHFILFDDIRKLPSSSWNCRDGKDDSARAN